MKYFLLLSFVLLTPLFALAAEAGQFVPLTSLPGLAEGGNAATMTVFLNSLYKICIGAAAAIAVLQIIRAGILFMTNKGSISENEQARSLVQGAVLGLLLVLSPVIVFTIINPKILTLDFGVAALKQDKPADVDLGASGQPIQQAAESIAAGVAAACTIPMDATQSACINTASGPILASYLTCKRAAEASTSMSSELNKCAATMRESGVAAANSCVSGLSQSQQTCIGDQLAISIQQNNPATPTGESIAKPASYMYVYRETTPPPACRLPDITKSFETVDLCKADMVKTFNDPNSAIIKDCDGKEQVVPAGRGAEIYALALCK